MNKLFKENGFLSEEGEQFLLSFKKVFSEILNSDEINMMTTSELRVFGSILSSMIANTISKTISDRTTLSDSYNAMSDERFIEHLNKKYDKEPRPENIKSGMCWLLFAQLSKEEAVRATKLIQNNIKALLKEGAENIPKSYHSGIIFDNKKRFK